MQTSARSGRGTGFFDLSLRTETRQYVPKLLAIRRIVADPQAFGLQFAPIPNRPYFDVVDPGRQVHIGNAAELAGVSQDDMFALNPAYNRQTTPPDGPHRLLLPVERAAVLRQAMLVPENDSRLWIAAVKDPSAGTHYVSKGRDALIDRPALRRFARRAQGRERDERLDDHFRSAAAHPGTRLATRPHGRSAPRPDRAGRE